MLLARCAWCAALRCMFLVAAGVSIGDALAVHVAPSETICASAQEDWAKRLEGVDADAARAELVALKGKAVEPLLAVLENGSDAAAFQAALAFAALAKDGKKGFEPLLALATRSDVGETRRAFAVLALRGAESDAKRTAPALTQFLLDEAHQELALAASLTLAALGKDAAKPLVDALTLGPAPVALRACSALVNLGAGAAGSVKELAALVEDRTNGARGFAAGIVLRALGPKAEKAHTSAWRKRGPQTGGAPSPLAAFTTAGELIELMRDQVSQRKPDLAVYDAEAVAMPEGVEDIDRDTYKTMIELYVCWSRHLGEIQSSLARDLAQPKAISAAEWAKRTAPHSNADRWMVALLAP